MKDDRQYIVADCVDRPGQLCVLRIGERSPAGYLVKVEGGYQIEDKPEDRVPKVCEKRVYEKLKDAALLVYMRGRAYRRVFDNVEGTACFEIRVSPRLDEEWVASLWQDEKPAGSSSTVSVGEQPRQSLEQAKYLALMTLYQTGHDRDGTLRLIAKEKWPDVGLSQTATLQGL